MGFLILFRFTQRLLEMNFRSIAFVFALTIMNPVLAGEAPDSKIVLAAGHPQQYTVVKGDTLWGIAAKFLRDPWRWKEIWQGNEQIQNPDLIYPGDVIYLSERDGQPILSLQQRVGADGTSLSADGPDGSLVKVSPTIRLGELSAPIPNIPMSIIGPFLSKPRVVSGDSLSHLPYIVSFRDGRLMVGSGSSLYVRNLSENTVSAFDVVRKGKPYRHHRTDKLLGYEALYVARADLQKRGDPATFSVHDAERAVMIGDRLIAVNAERGQFDIRPTVPTDDLRGAIIQVVDGVSQIGQHDIVVIDLGTEEGMQAGHVMSIFQSSGTVRDRVINFAGESVRLPEERAGLLLVFRTFDHISYGLVMDATRALHTGDAVRTPPL
jgi:hypothetical protein